MSKDPSFFKIEEAPSHSLSSSSFLPLLPEGGVRRTGMTFQSTAVTCELTYGFLPCTSGLWGELFLVAVYEYLLSVAAQYVTSGSNLFFRMFGTGVFGASAFQILGAIPQSAVMLATVISASTDTLETIAAMNIAMVAGSAIFSLTLVWGSIVAFGSHHLSQPSSAAWSNRLPFSLTGYGVETDGDTKTVGRIMIVSLAPFLVLQLTMIVNSTAGIRIVVLTSLVITLALLAAYCTHQVFQPFIQEKRLEYVLSFYKGGSAIRRLLTVNGKPDEDRIKDVFNKIDQNKDAKVSLMELYAFILGIQIEEVGMTTDEFANSLMHLFDVSEDQAISESEFVLGVGKWLSQLKPHTNGSTSRWHTMRLWRRKSEAISEEQQSLVLSRSQADTSKSRDELQVWWNYVKAGFLITLGTAIAAVLAQPLMESLDEFGTSAGIPSFFVSYVLLPLGMNYRQALAVIASAKKKTINDVSLTFTEVYNGVFMNNVVGLTVFLSLVYIRDISWDASAEVLVVLLICALMGVIASVSTRFPVWTSVVAFALYPVSLLLLYILTTILGWS
ncbi:hypothetical protein MLD38_010068 [Melastoma candidum]|uniref:Uncharacterized protein n=1 Tax=Melastoma candidum TaxID=119954 RepID=A0ACB9QZR3_9MYRT|nr:hypothetical protein MLD38_010068 [Melastoma candidum]